MWLFRIKRNVDGTIGRYKARLHAKDFTHRSSINFNATFSLVVKPTTVRIILLWKFVTIGTFGNLISTMSFSRETWTMKCTWNNLHGLLVMLNQHIYVVRKAIYSLKQDPHAWYNALTSYLSSMGFVMIKTDASLLF